MSEQEAYEKGQRDMRNRIERHFRTYGYCGELRSHDLRKRAQRFGSVAVEIRQKFKVQPMVTP